MSKVVPMQIEDGVVIYIEAEDSVTAPVLASTPIDSGEMPRNGSKGWGGGGPAQAVNPAQSMQILQSTIRTYTHYCLSAFKNIGTANVEEVTLEFGVNLSADAGIPYIASGKAQSNLKITVKCSYKQLQEKSPSGM
ncbi:MAG TPA: hypothetical protein IGS53_02940 [Leptolyngbyaceae cyanobacterium M33_DOE_097]|uniref:Trypsin-co-occurring domain-containing protein n=1 Tax=Oscillatoriales cyanobacterium SpSt-418 TaxID=2282169 RepID=A0A7C3KET6_9CYAN|nr:hypothetical protein [Leptolyngbyaceae cyanobacterium M33_DOE_097]